MIVEYSNWFFADIIGLCTVDLFCKKVTGEQLGDLIVWLHACNQFTDIEYDFVWHDLGSFRLTIRALKLHWK